MEKKIKEIIKKVRKMYQYDNRVSYLLTRHPLVYMGEDEIGDLELRSIRFLHYDSLIVTNKKITFQPEMRPEEVLIEYNGFDELLKL